MDTLRVCVLPKGKPSRANGGVKARFASRGGTVHAAGARTVQQGLGGELIRRHGLSSDESSIPRIGTSSTVQCFLPLPPHSKQRRISHRDPC